MTPDDLRRKEDEKMKKLEKSKRSKEERKCPACDMRVSFSLQTSK